MKHIDSFLSVLKRNSLAKSIVKKITPVRVRRSLYEYLNGGQMVRLYFENNIAHISFKSKNVQTLQGLMPVFYWDGNPNLGDLLNFGDVVGPYLISKITGKPVLNIKNLQYPGIMAVGSIIEQLDRKDMVIWGSGLMDNMTDDQIRSFKKYSPEILSVRGRETAKQLLEAGINVPDQSVYGDPALILPLFYNPSIRGLKKIGICPHFTHKSHFLENITDKDNLKIIDVQKDMETVVDSISSSAVCISTSLHGLIIAQAYNVPWVWLEVFDNNLKGNDFKFKDFFSTIDESKVSHVRATMEEVKNLDFKIIAEKATLPDKLYNQDLILKSLKTYLSRE